MSIKAYRLLRNNKEEGPFTAEEIIQKNLKPYDLIWVDGRSAAWNYPGEMPEFKMYVPVPGEESLTVQSTKQNVSVSPSIHAAIAVNENIVQPAIKQQKPRYKVSAAWNKIQTVTAPVYNNVMVAEPQKISSVKILGTNTNAAVQSKSLSWEEAWLDWEKEKTVTPANMPVKVKTASAFKIKTLNENYNTPALETKYAEPLDSLKDKYIENILRQKQQSKKRFSFGKASEFIVPSLALLIIFSVGYWLLHNNDTSSALNASPLKIQQPVKIENTNALAANANNNNIAANPVAQNNTNETQALTSADEPVATDEAEERKTNYVHAVKLAIPKADNNVNQQNKFPSTQISLPDSKSSAQKTIDTPAKQFDPSVINNIPLGNTGNNVSSSNTTGDLNAADSRPVRRRTNTVDNADNSSTQKNDVAAAIKPVNSKSSASYVSVPEYIQMNNGSADVKIENISDLDLDLIVVDVQYYDASGRFRKGETLYLHNLKAGKNVLVKTPKDMDAQYAISKVSLVSSDANNVYVIGDN